MPSFDVMLEQILEVRDTIIVIVDAENEEQAREKADELAQDLRTLEDLKNGDYPEEDIPDGITVEHESYDRNPERGFDEHDVDVCDCKPTGE